MAPYLEVEMLRDMIPHQYHESHIPLALIQTHWPLATGNFLPTFIFGLGLENPNIRKPQN